MANNKSLPPFQFITGTNPRLPHAEEVREACKAGVEFIQFREKNASIESTKRMAETAMTIAKSYNANFLVNDYVEVAKSIGADGVHVGYNDIPPEEARKQLGSNAIIGGTGNDFEHVQALYDQGVSYMGIGPFRYTNTKDELKPILGVEGYHQLVKQMRDAGIDIPVYAVGGLSPDDVDKLLAAGISGIAVSSAVGDQRNIYEAARAFLSNLSDDQ